MKTLNIRDLMMGVLLFLLPSLSFAHPTGNMITVGEHVLWSYINPIDDLNHYACVMIWTKGAEPQVFIQSRHAASDYMLYNKQDEIYIIERKYLQISDEFQVRVLRSTIDRDPVVIWDWFKDEHRIGEGGFFMRSDNEMVFGRYPEIYTLKKGEQPTKYFEFDSPISKIRAVDHGQILLMSDHSCYLVQQNGTILKQWDDLTEQDVKNAPMNRNQLSDMDYSNGQLLIAYWGRRSFDLVNASGKREILLQQTDPLVPHWATFWNKEKLLFSSRLVFDGSTPKPHLVLVSEQNKQSIVWNVQ